MHVDINTIVLAAGNSERMGQCKFLLPMNNGLTFFENIILGFSSFGITEVSVVTQIKYLDTLISLSKKNKLRTKFLLNHSPEHGRFYSVQLGIMEAKHSEFTFIHNADSPFIELTVLEKLYNNRENADVVCPVFKNKGGHPILVNKKVKNALAEQSATSVLNEALKAFKKTHVEVENELITANIDTPEDYRKYFSNKLI